MTHRRRDRGGFTLLELMMVVVIIGILASIALPQYLKTAERARAVEAYQILGTIRSAQQRFKAQSPANKYAATLGELDVDMPGSYGAWKTPELTGAQAIGVVTMARQDGTYKDKKLGVQYGTGKRCGDFPPEFPAAVACAED